MYKNKGLKRSYVFAYINVLFGLMVPSLLLMKDGIVGSIIMLILVLADLAALIVSHVFYTKDDKLFLFIGGGAVCGFDVLTIVGLVIEIIFTIRDEAAVYAWVFLSICVLAALLLTLFFFLDIRKKKMKAAEEAEKAANVKALFENA